MLCADRGKELWDKVKSAIKQVRAETLEDGDAVCHCMLVSLAYGAPSVPKIDCSYIYTIDMRTAVRKVMRTATRESERSLWRLSERS